MFFTAFTFALIPLWAFAASNEVVVKVDFFGEAQCPYCRKFVRETWPTVWQDEDLMEFVQYDFVAWGNAYFQIEQCSHGDSYDADERACWYSNCLPSITRQQAGYVRESDESDCYSGKVIYQHSEKEGQVDIFENCVKYHYGIEAAVDFTYCVEGDAMEQTDSAHDLLLVCQGDRIDPVVIEQCYQTHGHAVEVLAAKMTPAHPGVPYVLVDGIPLDDPFTIQQAICDRLKEKLAKQDPDDTTGLPKVCQSRPQADGGASSPFGSWIPSSSSIY